MGELITRIKDLSGTFAAASAVLYAIGFLVVRSRSRSLVGTHPEFPLIDQAYVFAGIQFAMISMIALLVAAPIVVALYRGARCLPSLLPARVIGVLRGAAALTLAILTLGLLFAVLTCDGIFACGMSAQPRLGFVRDAVLGRNSFGVFAVVLGTGLTALSVAWLWEHRVSASPVRLLTLVLVITVALQSVLLPLQVGAFFHNLGTQELAHAPNGLSDLAPPLWIVDRGADRTVLLALGSDRRFAIVTVKNEALDGIATTGRLFDDILKHGDLACSAASKPHSE